MSEFNNRIDIQRDVIKAVNNGRFDIQISGLSSKAIMRWASDNGLECTDIIVEKLLKISERLSFLATKSQEQITEDYKSLSIDVSDKLKELRKIL